MGCFEESEEKGWNQNTLPMRLLTADTFIKYTPSSDILQLSLIFFRNER